MTKQTFKAGDMVYCPSLTNKIVKLGSSGGTNYPLEFYCVGVDYLKLYACTLDGKLDKENPMVSICHATEESHAMLESLFGVEFEKPKKKPTPKEIIKHLLNKQKYLVCWVDDTSEDRARLDKYVELIYKVCDNDGEVYIYKGAGSAVDWRYAIPIDLQGKEITEIQK